MTRRTSPGARGRARRLLLVDLAIALVILALYLVVFTRGEILGFGS